MGWSILSASLFILLAPLVGGFLSCLDRRISARMQGRKGPPLLQPFYDLFKLFSNESFAVNPLQHFLVWGFLVFVIFSGALFFWGGDLLLVFFAITLAEIFFILSATSANSPYSTMGSHRELLQIMSYEPMILLAAIGFYKVTGSFNVSDIIKSDVPALLYLPGMFIGILFILTIKLRKSPFDLSTSHHAHQEIVKGITTELVGPSLGLVELAHWYENVFILGVVGLFVITGNWWGALIAVLVCIAAYFLEVLVDNTSARVKWQQMFRSSWLVTLVFGIVNLAILMWFF